MKEKTCKKVRLVYGSLLGAMTVILGALLIWQTLDIYFTGTAADYTGTYIFTRENVAERLAEISPAIWLWLFMAVIGFVLWEVFPVAEKRGKPDVRYTLWRLKKRVPSAVGEQLQASFNAVKREENILKSLWILCGAAIFLCAVYSIIYLSIPANFPAVESKTGPILEMVKNIMPCVAVVFLLCLGVAVYEGKSAKKQLEHVRKLAAGNKPIDKPHGKIYAGINGNRFGNILCKLYDKIYGFLHHKYFLMGVRIGVGCLGVAFVIAGIFNGSLHDVLVKAINICTECIGLG